MAETVWDRRWESINRKDKFTLGCKRYIKKVCPYTRKDSPADRQARQECTVLETLSKWQLTTNGLVAITGLPPSTLYATLRRLRGMVKKQAVGTWVLLEVGQV